CDEVRRRTAANGPAAGVGHEVRRRTAADGPTGVLVRECDQARGQADVDMEGIAAGPTVAGIAARACGRRATARAQGPRGEQECRDCNRATDEAKRVDANIHPSKLASALPTSQFSSASGVGPSAAAAAWELRRYGRSAASLTAGGAGRDDGAEGSGVDGPTRVRRAVGGGGG